MKILILNWRDIRSPRAGGAELLTHEVAKRLANRHAVTWFTSRPEGLPAEEDVDGVQVVRRGSEATTRLFAPRFAHRGTWDVVVEEINTLPYFAPAWSKARVVLFMAQLAREVWWYEAPRALAPFGWALEPLYLKTYRNVDAITISDSTRQDLRDLGFRRKISVLPMAVTTPAAEKLPPKEPTGRLIAVGRLVPSKRFDHAIRGVAQLRKWLPQATLTIVGNGRERESLEAFAERLGVTDAVTFAGSVPDETKMQLLAEADVLVATSAREGWGLTPTEAARVGTPAVGYDVPGLRDSIVDGRTGLLTDPSPFSLAAATKRLLGDRPYYDALRHAAWARSRDLSWDQTAASFERALQPNGVPQ